MCEREMQIRWSGLGPALIETVRNLGASVGSVFGETVSPESAPPPGVSLPTDVTLSAGGKHVRAHRFVLAACSPLFADIFRENPMENPIVVLQDVDFKALGVIVSFMYTGEVNVMEEFLPTVLKTGENLQIKGLSFIKERKADENVIENGENIENVESFQITTLSLEVENTDGDPDTKYDEDVIIFDGVEEICNFNNTDEINENKNNEAVTNCEILSDDNNFVSNNKKRSSEIDCNEIKKKKIKTVDQNYDDLKRCNEDPNFPIITLIEELSPDLVEHIKTYSNGDNKKNCGVEKHGFPCPFCYRIYQSWGYRRRHVKGHHAKNLLSCKWCKPLKNFDSDTSWYDHVIQNHKIAPDEAKDSLIILVEAHTVMNFTMTA